MMVQTLGKSDPLMTYLEGLSPVQAGWTAKARADALLRLRSMGLPTKKDEYWRYTDPSPFTALPAVLDVQNAEDEPSFFTRVKPLKLIFVDGKFDPDQSDDPQLLGVDISILSAVEGQDIHWAHDLYARFETSGQAPIRRPLAALNTAFATDGVMIRVGKKVDMPVLLVYKSGKDSMDKTDVMLRHCIHIEAGAQLTLLEENHSFARQIHVIEADVGEGAALHHVRLYPPGFNAVLASYLFSSIAKGGELKSFTLNAHGGLVRNENIVTMVGQEGIAHLGGAALVSGEKACHDDTIFLTHGAENCESRQVFKKVLVRDATAVFQGKILVDAIAQKTDGYQISQSILLDDGSRFLAKPELEIYADDVKCSHGSTSGAIDETALFYLQSRGIAKSQAQALLVLAFLMEAVLEIQGEKCVEVVQSCLEEWLKQSDTFNRA